VELVEIRLGSAHPDAQRPLYGEVLGLEVSDAAGAFAVQIGATRLVFEPRPSSPQHFAIRIPSAAYADALAWLAERVELLVDGDGGHAFAFPDWNADAAYFRDPDRNVVELIAHHDLPEPYRPPFRPGSMLGVCEVGVPVDDVGAYLRSLERRNGVRRWSGDGVRFAAAGDKRGSLIVVRRGRVWYPTADAEATAGPLRVDLGSAGLVEV
jgi:catechol 2,3-dioxygenase-like lactoylglutathione lyase family enzyme